MNSQSSESQINSEKDDVEAVCEHIKSLCSVLLLCDEWDEAVTQCIKEWCSSVTQLFLVVFIAGNKMNASLDVIRSTTDDVNRLYFLRKPMRRLTIQSFDDDVTFGKFTGHADEILAKLVENIYMPAFGCATDTINDARIDLCTIFQKLLISITGTHSKQLGAPILYVPSRRAGYELLVNEINNAHKTRMLDSLGWLWIDVIRRNLEVSKPNITDNLHQLIDEHRFYAERGDILRAIQLQLVTHDVRLLIDQFSGCNSYLVHEIHQLAAKLESQIAEANNNAVYLSLLLQPCYEFNNSDTLEVFPVHLLCIIQKIKFVWLRSAYLNSTQSIVDLLRMLSNQLMANCRSLLNMNDVWHYRFDDGVQFARVAIDCCAYYREIFVQVFQGEAVNVEYIANRVFGQIDVFEKRLLDLIELCEFHVVYERTLKFDAIICDGNEINDIHVTFTGAHRQIRLAFLQIHADVRTSTTTMLDIHDSDWRLVLRRLVSAMRRLDQMVLDLIECLFGIETNIEEAIQILYLLNHLSDRKTIYPVYTKYVEHVCQLYSYDMTRTNMQMCKESNIHLSCIPKCANELLAYNIHSQRMQWLANLFEAADWLPKAKRHAIHAQHEEMMNQIKVRTSEIFNNWKTHLTNDYLKSITKHSLMKKIGARNEFLQCNIDNFVFQVLSDANFLEFMHCILPPSIKQIHAKAGIIKLVHSKVMQIVRDYNQMQQSMTPSDRDLFRVFLLETNRIIIPGVKQITWDDDTIEPFILECGKKSEQIRSALNLFRSVNLLFRKFSENIANTVVCQIDEKSWESEASILEQLTIQQTVAKDAFNRVFNDGFNRMIEIVSLELQKHATRIRSAWTFYLEKIDNLVKVSFTMSIMATLNRLYDVVHGKHFEPISLFDVHAHVSDECITLVPNLDGIQSFLVQISEIPIAAIQSFMALSRKYVATANTMPPYYKSIQAENAYQNEIRMVREEIQTVRIHVDQWLTFWQQIIHSIHQTQSEIETQFTNNNCRSSVLTAQLDEYTRLSKEISTCRVITKAHFVNIKAADVKATLNRRVKSLKESTLLRLKSLSRMKLTFVYDYMTENTRLMAMEPKNPDQIEQSLQLHHTFVTEAKNVAAEFVELYAYFEILDENIIAIETDVRAQVDGLDRRWQMYLAQFEQSEAMLEEARMKVKYGLLNDKVQLDVDVTALRKMFELLPTSPSTPIPVALEAIDSMQEQLHSLIEREAEIFRQLKQIHVSANRNEALGELQTKLDLIKDIWLIAGQWERAWADYKLRQISTADTMEMENCTDDLIGNIKRATKRLDGRSMDILTVTQKRLTDFSRTLPLLKAMRNAALRPRHWSQIKAIVCQRFDEFSDDFNLGAVIEMQFLLHFDKVTDISQAATMELQVESNLANVEKTWTNMTMDFIAMQEDLYRIAPLDDCFVVLEDNLLQVLTMKGTRYGEPFMDSLDYWAKTLNNIQETLEMALSVQQIWMYLRNIFQAKDIRQQLPVETALLMEVTQHWGQLTCEMAKGSNIIKSTHCISADYLRKNFAKLLEQLESIQRALEVYLEKKRQIFPRFYFISDDDLLDVLGNAAKPEQLQKHFHKLYDNIERCDMKSSDPRRAVRWQISGMHSSDGESVKFLDMVQVIGPAESWLRDIESSMRRVLKAKILVCIKDLLDNSDPDKIEKWLQKWPAQLCLTASKIQWTLNCTKTLKVCKQLESVKPHRKLYKRQCAILAVLSEMSRRALTKQTRLKVNSIITIQLHGRDVIQRLHRYNCQNVSHFEWFSQLRFYWDRTQSDCAIRQTNTLNWYSYEYSGNSGRLIITPLTDRCYITLTTALHMFLGGSPKGPAGTGKTETVKDLGKVGHSIQYE